MSHTRSLYVYTKNTDLHALSAKETLCNVMGVSALKQLRRFELWTLTFNSNAEEADQQLQTLVSSTYYLLNPNKQGMMFELNLRSEPDMKHWILRVQNRFRSVSEILKKIKQRGFSSLITLEHEICWDIVTSSSISREEILSDIVQSDLKGLLLNPLTDTFTLV